MKINIIPIPLSKQKVTDFNHCWIELLADKVIYSTAFIFDEEDDAGLVTKDKRIACKVIIKRSAVDRAELFYQEDSKCWSVHVYNHGEDAIRMFFQKRAEANEMLETISN